MRYIGKQRIVLLLQLACSILFVALSVTSVALRGRSAVMAAIPERATCESTEDEPSESEPAPDGELSPTEPSEDGLPIVQVDLSIPGEDGLLFKNETDYVFDSQLLLNSGYPIEPAGDGPTVLIIHSHATECYTEPEATAVTDTRSHDPERNVLAVGRILAHSLEENGISALHCTVLHDSPSYSEAYIRSKETVREYLAQYPSIQYVIDLHRDAISTSEGGMAKPMVNIDGVDYAQMMLVVGTDEGGAEHPGWRTNLCVAAHTQVALTEYCGELMRPINLRSASFNQQLSQGYLLLEIGSCANTLSEAKASAALFGEIFAEMIKNP